MPAPLSKDLRDRFLAAYQANEGSQRVLAVRFGIGPATAERWWNRFRDTGSIEAYPTGGRTERMLKDDDLESIDLLIASNPALTVAELIEAFVGDGGERVSRTTMTRALQTLELTRKKTRRASRR